MPSLMDLFPEILEEVAMKLESVEDVISLGSSCTDLARIVGQERIWRVLLARTELVVEEDLIMEDRVKTITSFLSSFADSDAIFFLLHQTVYNRYPATGQGWQKDSITVSSPSSPQLHSVSGLGLQLLALTDREEARHTVHEVKIGGDISPSLMLSLASLQRDQITALVVEGGVKCTTEEEGSALVSLLECSTTWKVWRLDLSGEVGELTWEGLGREVARVNLGLVSANREVVRRGRREDLRAVWQPTGLGWGTEVEMIWTGDGEEEGWRKIEEIIQ